MSSKDKTLIADLMEGFVSEVPANPFVSFCVACNKGVIKEEMTYEKGKVFHNDCYIKHGSNFPPVNPELQSENSNAKIQLIQLKNLKIRMMGVTNTDTSQTKKKTAQKVKKRKPKRRVIKKRKNSKKRKLKKRITRKKLSRKKAKKSKRKSIRKRVSKRLKRRTRKRR